jgi:phage N-6-adenine-methyltransferase
MFIFPSSKRKTPKGKAKKTDDWRTPKDLFNHFNAIHRFDLDAAASHENHLCGKYFTVRKSALTRRWYGAVWCNPPYSHIAPFVRKAYEESKEGATVVMLIPAWTDQTWFHQYCRYAEVTFIERRVSFIGTGSMNTRKAPYFPSMIITFFPGQKGRPHRNYVSMRLSTPGADDLAAKLFKATQELRKAEEREFDLIGTLRDCQKRLAG